MTSNQQISMFETFVSDETDVQTTRWNEFVAIHPLRYHIVRLDPDGIIYHINTIYKDYNDSHYPKEPYENRLTKYSLCNSVDELIILEPSKAPKVHYVLAAVDYKKLKALKNFYQ